MEWVKKHKVLTVIGVLIVLSVIGSAANGGSNNNPSAQPSSSQAVASSPQASTKPKLDIAAFYGKVQNGMTKEEVVALADKDPGSCTESETQGLGTYEICNWYGSFGDNAFATVQFQNGKVSSKSKTGF